MKQVLCTLYEMFILRFEKVMVRPKFFLFSENYDHSPGQYTSIKNISTSKVHKEVSLDSQQERGTSSLYCVENVDFIIF